MNEHQNNPPRSATNDNRTRLRLFVEYDLEDGHAVPANPDQHNYLRKVMRRKDGDMVALFNGRHGEWLARIAYESKSRCVLIVEQHLREQRVPPDVWSLFAPVKASPMNNIARMSTELGVGRICPVLTEHTDVTRVNTARLRANAVEAAEQSTRLNVPMVDEPSKSGAIAARMGPGKTYHPVRRSGQCGIGAGGIVACAARRGMGGHDRARRRVQPI